MRKRKAVRTRTPRSMSATPRKVPFGTQSGSAMYAFWTFTSREMCCERPTSSARWPSSSKRKLYLRLDISSEGQAPTNLAEDVARADEQLRRAHAGALAEQRRAGDDALEQLEARRRGRARREREREAAAHRVAEEVERHARVQRRRVREEERDVAELLRPRGTSGGLGFRARLAESWGRVGPVSASSVRDGSEGLGSAAGLGPVVRAHP